MSLWVYLVRNGMDPLEARSKGILGGRTTEVNVRTASTFKKRDENAILNSFLFSLTSSPFSLLIGASSREEEAAVVQEEDHPWLKPSRSRGHGGGEASRQPSSFLSLQPRA
ncbi:hypothetical protein Lal_00031425 [Lupinus albus]|nr:hypothetical protein Lal_00031425 [Lupinus albus]